MEGERMTRHLYAAFIGLALGVFMAAMVTP